MKPLQARSSTYSIIAFSPASRTPRRFSATASRGLEEDGLDVGVPCGGEARIEAVPTWSTGRPLDAVEILNQDVEADTVDGRAETFSGIAVGDKPIDDAIDDREKTFFVGDFDR